VLHVLGDLLGDPERQRRVARDRDERVELAVGRAHAGHGLVHRDHAEQLVARVAQRDEQRVARQPGVRVVGRVEVRHVRLHPERVPVELAVGHEVRALGASEAVGEQRGPGVVGRDGPEQRVERLLRADGGGGEHVVEGRAVHVHDHCAVAEHLADRPRHVLQHLLEVGLVADRRHPLEHRAEARDRGEPLGHR
jgi:hypothetical protein